MDNTLMVSTQAPKDMVHEFIIFSRTGDVS